MGKQSKPSACSSHSPCNGVAMLRQQEEHLKDRKGSHSSVQAGFTMGLKGQELWGGTSQIRGVPGPKICLSRECSRKLRRLHYIGQTLGLLCRKQMSESKREGKRGRLCSGQKRKELVQD